MTKRSRGFTLVELIISMSLFVILSTALISLLTHAMDFLKTGTAGSEVTDKATDFLRPFGADVQNVLVEQSVTPGPSRIRFYSDHVPIDVNGDNRPDYMAQRLAFVRSTREELANPVTRAAGSEPGAEEYIRNEMPPVIDAKGVKDPKVLKEMRRDAEKKLHAAGGMEEVLYIAIPSVLLTGPETPPAGEEKAATSFSPKLGLLTLYRATRSPIGGKGSLLDPATIRTPADVKKLGKPLLTGILYFGVTFGTPVSQGPSMGAITTWDSTRGILPAGYGPDKFPFAIGPSSLDDPRDDISPRSLTVTLVFERTGGEEKRITLGSPMTDSVKTMDLPDTAFTNASGTQFVKVGSEWMHWGSRTPYALNGLTRGARDTFARSHEAGEPVRAGYTVKRQIMIPAYREDYNTGPGR